MKRYFFDYAGATPVDEGAMQKMIEAQACFANPSSLHAEGREAREALEISRQQIAMVLGAKAQEIIFTSGATESDNLEIMGAITASGGSRVRVITVPTEHLAVRSCMQVVQASGHEVCGVVVDKTGMVDIASLEKLISDRTVLISIAMATSEIGTIQPIAQIGRIVRATRADRRRRGIATPISFHTDASSVLGYLPLGVDKLGVDMMTLSSAKSYGPPGIGALYIRRDTPLVPMMVGGRQEMGLRSGTPAVALAVGFAEAGTKAEAMRHDEVARMRSLRTVFLKEIGGIGGAQINGHRKKCVANLINLSFAGWDGEDLVLALDAVGFAVATGASCSQSRGEPSHVLLGIGRTRAEAQSSLRISFGRETTGSDVKKLASAIRKIVVK